MNTAARATLPSLLLGLGAVIAAPAATAVTVASGNAVLSIDQAAFAANSKIDVLDAWFDNSETRAQLLANPAPGDGFTLPNINFAVNTGVLVSPAGRTLQTTDLDYNPADVLGSWTAGSDLGAFLAGGEQIGLEGMTRWTGDYTGVLLFGDFAIRYAPGRVGQVRDGNTLSGLVLTSNIDFANATFLDIANALITANASGLSITGDLVISDGFKVLDSSAVLGADVGDINLTAAAVPLPGALPLLASGLAGLVAARRRRNAAGRTTA